VLDKYRFRFFAMRDEMALMVVNGQLEEESWQYQTIIDAINHNIRTIEDVSDEHRISMLLADLVRPEAQKRVRQFSQQLEEDRVKAIVYDYFVTTRSLIVRSGRFMPWGSKSKISATKLYFYTMNRLHQSSGDMDVNEISLQGYSLLQRLEEAIPQLEPFRFTDNGPIRAT